MTKDSTRNSRMNRRLALAYQKSLGLPPTETAKPRRLLLLRDVFFGPHLRVVREHLRAMAHAGAKAENGREKFAEYLRGYLESAKVKTVKPENFAIMHEAFGA